MPCFYLLMGPDEELDLARAELWALAGCTPHGRVATGTVTADISRAAYVRLCAEQLAAGSNWPELQQAIAALKLHCEEYRIAVFRPAPKVAVNATSLQKSIADLISGTPNIDHPRREFAVIITPNEWQFGPIISRSRQGWRSQVKHPYHYSHALAPQMARALVNLVAAPGDTLLDLCCGSGTIVAEALSEGIYAWGVEINPALAGQTAVNLRALGLAANVIVGDARNIRGNFDAAIVDFPYGHSSPVAPDLYRDILVNLREQVERMALVFGGDQGWLLEQLALSVRQQATVVKGRLTRHIYVVTSKKGQRPAR